MNANGINTTQTVMRDIVTRAAEFICKENQHGSWLDARTNAACIWAISNCGLAKSHYKFMNYAIGVLLEDSERDEDRLCWNFEIWDTSVSAIAIKKGGGSIFSRRFSEIRRWLLYEYSEIENNFRNEPWETLWALHALLCLGRLSKTSKQVIKDCLSWVLSKRTKDGVLISPHYVGLLLAVMTYAFDCLTLSKKEKLYYEKAIRQSISYLVGEGKAKMKKESLWNDEPWSIGLILHGLAVSCKWDSAVFRDADFNNFLTDWCAKRWNSSQGWVDLVDTSNLLIGLSEYYIQKEIISRGLDCSKNPEIQKEISADVKFEFRDVGSMPMTVYPIWKERKFKLKKKSCCLLMPYKKSWSDKIHMILINILGKNGFDVFRADDLHQKDVIER